MGSYGYVVNCVVCKKPYRKFSSNSHAGKCTECRKDNTHKVKPQSKNSDLMGSQMHNQEMRIEKLEQDSSMVYEHLEDEIRKNMREMCREIIEAYIHESKEDYKQGLKNIRASFKTETRELKKEFEETIIDKIGHGNVIEKELTQYTKDMDERFFKLHGQLATINSRNIKKFEKIGERFPKLFGDE